MNLSERGVGLRGKTRLGKDRCIPIGKIKRNGDGKRVKSDNYSFTIFVDNDYRVIVKPLFYDVLELNCILLDELFQFEQIAKNHK